MAALRKWRALAPAERWLLLRALVLVAGFRAALLLVPFQRLRRLAEHRAGTLSPQANALARTGWAIAVAADLGRGSTCLPQALAAQALLGWQGCASSLHIGVARGLGGRIEAHAWVESHGTVVVGGTPESLARYSRLPLERISA
ncbi:hypothetical protein SE17_09610 [Kouleothrix aurantiaca]|uniref:Microcin J25-processing protein McjB C-terminal domain-containing protein n=1 Tax=Kouleothrix aurantiaca TaxID=186479 RepID=A0A0P9D327_9CHLR|nr:hypothetical protein SE17_09610 [Kouleothrix aurantiaca]